MLVLSMLVISSCQYLQDDFLKSYPLLSLVRPVLLMIKSERGVSVLTAFANAVRAYAISRCRNSIMLLAGLCRSEAHHCEC